ncbi:hypothetical protein FZC33_20670 [Labrys sp. KNU-23]|nr:hypothetical protein FZC33_20670 [Labrys sp. KNU-23]
MRARNSHHHNHNRGRGWTGRRPGAGRRQGRPPRRRRRRRHDRNGLRRCRSSPSRHRQQWQQPGPMREFSST